MADAEEMMPTLLRNIRREVPSPMQSVAGDTPVRHAITASTRIAKEPEQKFRSTGRIEFY